MATGTPEELEMLFEDALVLKDGAALEALFAAGAVLALDDTPPVRGEGLSRAVLARWGYCHPYVAAPRQVLVARDIALIVGERGANVALRDRERGWRYAIVRQTTGGNGKETES